MTVVSAYLAVLGLGLIVFALATLLRANGANRLVAICVSISPLVIGYALSFLSVGLGYGGSLYAPIFGTMIAVIGSMVTWQAQKAARRLSDAN